MRVVVGLAGVLVVACNGIAGIADLRTGDFDAAISDGAATNDSAVASDSATEGDAAPLSCGQDLSLSIKVEPSTSYSRVVDSNLIISVNQGATFAICVPVDTSIDLRGDPDDSNAPHTWAGAPCLSPAGRCSFKLQSATAIDVTF